MTFTPGQRLHPGDEGWLVSQPTAAELAEKVRAWKAELRASEQLAVQRAVAAEREVARLKDALERLGSSEAFGSALDLGHSSARAIADELGQRIGYARAALAEAEDTQP